MPNDKRKLEGTIFGWHRHVCPDGACGHAWQHDGALSHGMTYEEFEQAHHCAKCGAESRQCYMPDWTTVKAQALTLANGLGQWCRALVTYGRPGCE